MRTFSSPRGRIDKIDLVHLNPNQPADSPPEIKTTQKFIVGDCVTPLVCIILPYFNGKHWLWRTIQSVQQQTESGWELIIVDDGSDDDPGPIVETVRDSRIRLLRMRHSGKGAALNHGVSNARADIVCFLDQDDIMLPQRLATQLKVFGSSPGVDGVYSDYERRYDSGRLIDQFFSQQAGPREAIHLMAIGCSPVTMQTLMLKRAIYESLTGFSKDSRLTGLDDIDFFIRLFLAGANLMYVPGVVQSWTRHDQNFSNSEQFQLARLFWLKRLDEYAQNHLILRRELKHFKFHTYSMRGLHFLEKNMAELAVVEFYKAFLFNPRSINTYYLFLKSVARSSIDQLRSLISLNKKKYLY